MPAGGALVGGAIPAEGADEGGIMPAGAVRESSPEPESKAAIRSPRFSVCAMATLILPVEPRVDEKPPVLFTRSGIDGEEAPKRICSSSSLVF